MDLVDMIGLISICNTNQGLLCQEDGANYLRMDRKATRDCPTLELVPSWLDTERFTGNSLTERTICKEWLPLTCTPCEIPCG